MWYFNTSLLLGVAISVADDRRERPRCYCRFKGPGSSSEERNDGGHPTEGRNRRHHRTSLSLEYRVQINTWYFLSCWLVDGCGYIMEAAY